MSARAWTWSLLWLLASCAERAPWDEAPAAALAVRAVASASEVGVLDPFEVTVDAFRRADLPASFEPVIPDGFAGSVRIEQEQPLGHGMWRRARLSLRRTGNAGDVQIPPFSLQSDDKTASAQSDPIALRVHAALPGGDASDVEDPSPLLASSRPSPWALAAGVLAVAIAIVLLIVRLTRGPTTRFAVAFVVAVPPHEKALAELARWRAARRSSAAEIDAYYVGVSLALRVYLEERFSLRAPERTTEEFLAEIEAGGPLTTSQCIVLKQFLAQCDLVKFAMHVPTEQQHLEAMAIAENFVLATRPDLQQGVRA